jgi:hypothetical protein
MKQAITKEQWEKTNKGVTVVIGESGDGPYVLVSPCGKEIEDRTWDHSCDLLDLGISAPNGIKIWEEDELGMETFRDPTEAEWACIDDGLSPWTVEK